jgi:hypothetical protein
VPPKGNAHHDAELEEFLSSHEDGGHDHDAHAHTHVDDSDDERVAGVPRTISPAAKRLVAVVVALAALLVVVGGLRALRARQERQVEEVNARAAGHPAPTAVTPSAPAATTAAPSPVAPGAVASVEVPPADTVASAAPSVTAAAPPSTTTSPAPADTAPVALTGAAPPVAANPPGPTAQGAETAIDTPGATGGSLLSQAARALKKGDTTKAVSLARQAVAENPGNADAWLTLGAAYQASGNSAAAHDAYRSCAKQAHFANVTECFALAGK